MHRSTYDRTIKSALQSNLAVCRHDSDDKHMGVVYVQSTLWCTVTVGIEYYGLECVFMSKSLADSLNFCWSKVMYNIFNISESACAKTIIVLGPIWVICLIHITLISAGFGFIIYMYYNFLISQT